MTQGSTASEFSMAVLAEFVRLGVRHVVLCPGSRSQALALAAAQCEEAGLLTLTVRIDERGAGFLGLGLAVETGMPALVITTSGTAVGNLLPAVMEAHHSGVPMILLTADRPEELRGIGSNQTTDQLGIFGTFAAFAREVEAPSTVAFDQQFPAQLARAAFLAATGRSGTPGAVQVNMAYREPLSGDIDPVALDRLKDSGGRTGHSDPGDLQGQAGSDGAAAARGASADRAGTGETITPEPFTVVVAGHAAGEAAEETARALGAPLLAEVSSGAHFGRNLVVAYRELLNLPEFGGRVRRVIVFGHPTLSREIPSLIERADVETIVIRGHAGEAYNPGHRVKRFVDAVNIAEPSAEVDASWLGSWVSASRTLLDDGTSADPAAARTDDHRAVAEFTKAQLEVFREPVTRRMLVEAVWQKTWPHDRLVFGSSRLIREADRVVPGKRIRVHANRGLAGIDGTVATAAGIALASQYGAGSGNAPAGTTRVVLGDLALLHDAGSLLTAPGEPETRIQVIVGNDGGGTIFDSLEVAETARKPAFDRVMYTPHEVKFEALAHAYGWNHILATNRGQLDEALGSAGGRTIIEVPLPR
ncbi:MAG TPA: 2-succinyl-5-enolpyruvyl-6-hydroxy-3-cyclohexene-1-carboxylic-acid synthase [Terrimesophilobacter sp.]|nr:2-succinyl-5-enolpyruvyl-6-hydroxy-3-cyclohexene-1-carboxylic-acid synthase [Terrimesophilobacter sp.]